MSVLFSSQQHAITPGALQLLEKINYRPQLLLSRHFSGDWSELDPFDAAQNRDALKNGLRIVSAYSLGTHRLWVITEADRSVTTILLPSEY